MRNPKIAYFLAALILPQPCLSIVQMPPGPHTIGFLNGTEFVLQQDYNYHIGSSDLSIVVPAGFVTDFASIPGGFRAFFQSQDQYSRAALIHDYLYWSQGCTRLQADNLFLIAMKESKVGSIRRSAIYRGVRLGGSSAWNNNAKERRLGKPRVVPGPMFDLADKHSWKQARNVLISRDVKDPKFSVDLAACALGNSTAVP